MERRRLGWLAGAFLAAFFAIGLFYWRIPYAQVSLPSSLPGVGLIVTAAAAALARAFGGGGLVTSVLAAAAGAPVAVLARVIVDVSRDGTTHNLWPFEVVIAAAVGGVCALAGAVVGSLLLLLKSR
jgi:hypothetical protein